MFCLCIWWVFLVQHFTDPTPLVIVHVIAIGLGVFFQLLGIAKHQIDRVVFGCPLTANAIVIMPPVEGTHNIL